MERKLKQKSIKRVMIKNTHTTCEDQAAVCLCCGPPLHWVVLMVPLAQLVCPHHGGWVVLLLPLKVSEVCLAMTDWVSF